VPYAVAAALIVLAGGGSAAYAFKHHHTAASQHPADVTVTITVPAKHAAATTSATPTTLPIAPPYTTEPAVTTPGTLQPPPSHVSGVTVSTPALTGSNGIVACVNGPETVTGSLTLVVNASSSAPVRLSWATSQNSSPSPGPVLASGSRVASGQTSYAVTIAGVSFGSIPRPLLCGSTYFVAAVTATGSDGQSVTSYGSYFVRGA
jgi:hypothetical protein